MFELGGMGKIQFWSKGWHCDARVACDRIRIMGAIKICCFELIRSSACLCYLDLYLTAKTDWQRGILDPEDAHVVGPFGGRIWRFWSDLGI